MKREIKSLFLITAVLLLINPNGALLNKTTSSTMTLNGWSNESWGKSKPILQGLNPLNVKDMYSYIERHELDISHIMILKNGYNVAEKDYIINLWGETGYNDWVFLRAIESSIVATAIGKAVKNGYVNLSQKIVDYFPKINTSQLDPLVLNITIEHLLTMTAGFENVGAIQYNEDFFFNILNRSIITEPGTKFYYDKYQDVLLASIGNGYVTSTILDFTDLGIFIDIPFEGLPLGFGNVDMPMDNLMKFGYIYLNNGYWDNEEYVAKDWVNYSLTKQVKINDQLSYGYSWIINEKQGWYSAGGFSNNQLFIFPEKNTVVGIVARYSTESYLEHYYYIIENILFNNEANIILGFSIGLPLVMTIIISVIVVLTVKKIKKRN